MVCYPYDPARARDLLERSGATREGAGSYQWGDERRMAMTIEYAAGNETREATARRDQEDYERIGLVIGLRPAPIADLVGRIRFGKQRGRRLDPVVLAGADPSPLLFWHSNATGHSNRTGYSNPRADEAMIAGPGAGTVRHLLEHRTVVAQAVAERGLEVLGRA